MLFDETGAPAISLRAAQTRADMPTKTSKIRRAVPGDVDMVQRVSADAYIPAYMSVLGTIPKPATEDYRPRIERGEVWILEIEGEPTGIVVLEGNAEHLLIYAPLNQMHNGKDMEELCSISRINELSSLACTKFGFTRTSRWNET